MLHNFCWNVTTSAIFTFKVFNNFADVIFICVIKTKNCVKLSLFNINNAEVILTQGQTHQTHLREYLEFEE